MLKKEHLKIGTEKKMVNVIEGVAVEKNATVQSSVRLESQEIRLNERERRNSTSAVQR